MSARNEGNRRISLALEIGDEAERLLNIAATIRGTLILPESSPDILFICLPGGGMNRHYFDLDSLDDEPNPGFAKAMTAAGFAVALLDPLGIGESDAPPDPYLLTPDLNAIALSYACTSLLDMARTGDISGVAAMPGLRSVGVGHSHGAGLTLATQALNPVHTGLALLGFGVAPLARLAPPEEASLPIAEARARFSEFARQRYPTPYLPFEPMGGRYAGMLINANDRLLATAAYATVLPNAFAPDADSLSSPLFLAFGDRDIHGPPHRAAAAYPNCPDLTILVLPETRHNHFVYPSRASLFDRLAYWARGL